MSPTLSHPLPLTTWIAVILLMSYPKATQSIMAQHMMPTGVGETAQGIFSVPVSRLTESWSSIPNRLPTTASALVPEWKQPVPAYGNASLGTMAACPWEILTNTDPLRIPRDIRYARCLSSNPQLNLIAIEQPSCKENRLTIPILYCDQDPIVTTPHSCQLFAKPFAFSCVAAFDDEVSL